MTEYRIIFEDPTDPDAPAMILVPSPNWMADAMAGNLPPISVYWALQDEEQKAIDEGRHEGFKHDHDMWMQQFTAPRIGPLTEEEAIDYLIMFKVVTKDQVPSDRLFRNAWRLAA